MSKIKSLNAGDRRSTNRKKGLAQQLLADRSVIQKYPKSKGNPDAIDGENKYVGEKLSKQILAEARKQREEIETEHGIGRSAEVEHSVSLGPPSPHTGSDSEGSIQSEDEDYFDCLAEDITEADEAALARFMCPKTDAGASLSQTLQEKITEKQTEIQSQMSDGASQMLEELDERVVTMYKSIRDILTKYRSGKLPKAFKVIPALRNWEQVLYLTSPDTWSAAAMYQATRLFSSNLKIKMAQRFYNLVLFPRMRDDISEYKRLNYHIYQALKRSLFKPAAFFKGILLPLCEAGNCTLREATILASIITKDSIPMLHSAAAMLKIAEMQYNGANSIFLRALIDKKYALPYRVVDALVFHFLQFEHDSREMPVLWHQCLLAFCQRYKQDVSAEQKTALINLLRHQHHGKITPEIRRELVSAGCRDDGAVVAMHT